MRRLFLLPLLFFAMVSAQTIDPASKIGYQSINAANLKAYLTVLTSDSLEGRETSFPGQRKAANYIAGVFKNLKLDAIGDNGTYFQHFNVEVTRVNPKTNIVIEQDGKKKNYTWKTDFIAEAAKDTIVSGPSAFVGFTDTELDSASTSKLDGRVVFVFIGKKSFANDTSKAAAMRRFFSVRRDPGAAAVLMIPDYDGPATFENAKKMISSFGLDNGTMKMIGGTSRFKSNYVRLIVSPEMVEGILKSTGRTLKQIREDALQDRPFKPLFLDNVKISIESIVDQETKQTENVVGLLQGSDPVLKTQVVAFTAHYDHLGKTNDGVIFRGADDDGSGTAAVLELASAFVKNPKKPKRSLLFLTVVGEEKGLFGSQFYTSNPIIPLDQTISDLNMDMIGRLDTINEAKKDTNNIYVIGSNRISNELDSLLLLSNKETNNIVLDYKYNDEHDPERLYYRSDHYNFAKSDVPVIFFNDGNHKDYHRPTDTIDKILFERMAKIGQLIYNLGWKLGNIDRMLVKKAKQE